MSRLEIIGGAMVTVCNTDAVCPSCNNIHPEESYWKRLQKSKKGFIYKTCNRCKGVMGITTDIKCDVQTWLKSEEKKLNKVLRSSTTLPEALRYLDHDEDTIAEIMEIKDTFIYFNLCVGVKLEAYRRLVKASEIDGNDLFRLSTNKPINGDLAFKDDKIHKFNHNTWTSYDR